MFDVTHAANTSVGRKCKPFGDPPTLDLLHVCAAEARWVLEEVLQEEGGDAISLARVAATPCTRK